MSDIVFAPSLRRPCAVSIGNFDGVHCGHAEIVRRLKWHGLPTVVFTFSPHPRQVLRPAEAPELLTWNERKVALLKALGIDEVVICPAETVLSLSPEAFFEEIIVQTLDAKVLVEGANFCFGKGRKGTTKLLKGFCTHSGRVLELVETLHKKDGEAVSSSRIREHISHGEIEAANELLTEPYRIRGRVIHGEARGRTMGFPTANLAEIDTLLPAIGVYACRAFMPDGVWYPAAVHIGPNVTFHETRTKVEVHILDFCDSVYDKCIELEFVAHLRDLITFKTQEELMAQIAQDVAETRSACALQLP